MQHWTLKVIGHGGWSPLTEEFTTQTSNMDEVVATAHGTLYENDWSQVTHAIYNSDGNFVCAFSEYHEEITEQEFKEEIDDREEDSLA